QGVPQDDAEAVKWYRKAAEQGDDRAQFELGWGRTPTVRVCRRISYRRICGLIWRRHTKMIRMQKIMEKISETVSPRK
ncbi:MAG: hypothetical protein ABSG91_24605, partial [Syntrophobacteraceae bacterium]